MINLALLCYVLALQFYFFRYLVCDSCFKEYQQLVDDVEESGKDMDAKRLVYEKAKKA